MLSWSFSFWINRFLCFLLVKLGLQATFFQVFFIIFSLVVVEAEHINFSEPAILLVGLIQQIVCTCFRKMPCLMLKYLSSKLQILWPTLGLVACKRKQVEDSAWLLESFAWTKDLGSILLFLDDSLTSLRHLDKPDRTLELLLDQSLTFSYFMQLWDLFANQRYLGLL